MNKEEVLKLANELGSTENLSEEEIGKIVAFANACEKIGMEKARDMLSDALQSDLEHGVKWLNENAAKDFHDRYPALSKVIGEINSI